MGVAYDRRYELTLAKPTGFFGQNPNALVIRAMEVKFKIERSLEPTPNTAEILVYNLNDASRAIFQKKPLHVRLTTGYTSDTTLIRLIEGDLMFATTTRVGPDAITKFVIGDGERAFVEARVNASFSGGVNARTAISTVAQTMGLTMPKSASEAGEFLKQFSSGVSLRGPSQKVMSKLTKGTGFGWSMQDGQLQMLRDKDVRAGLAELISVQTGMIGSPDFAAPAAPDKPAVCKFKVQLRPQLIPGGRVKIESAEINGLFRIAKVTHTGDFRDNDWYTECESNPL